MFCKIHETDNTQILVIMTKNNNTGDYEVTTMWEGRDLEIDSLSTYFKNQIGARLHFSRITKDEALNIKNKFIKRY